MDWLKILQEIFTVCIIPLLGILTKYLVDWIQTKKNTLIQQEENEIKQRYIEMLASTVETCVIATNQTYVNALKDKNAFTLEAQKEAFEITKNAILAILGEEGQNYLKQIYGDLNIYIMKEIEKNVNIQKNSNKPITA